MSECSIDEYFAQSGSNAYESEIEYDYDALGRVTSQGVEFGMDNFADVVKSELGFAFDSAGKLDSRTVRWNPAPASGSLTDIFTDHFDFDALGRTTQIDQTIEALAATHWQGGAAPGDKAVRFGYNADGSRATMTRSQNFVDVAQSVYQYNSIGLTKGLTHSSLTTSNPIASYAFAYDNALRMSSRGTQQHAGNGGSVFNQLKACTYDEADQLACTLPWVCFESGQSAAVTS